MELEKKEELLEEAKKLMPEYKFEFTTITKRNDCAREAMYIKSDDGRAAPLFYLDDYEGLSPKEMAEAAKEIIEEFSIRQEEFKETLLSPNFIKDNVRLQLVNTERNREFLKDKPTFKAGSDLSATLYVTLGENGEAKAFLTNAIADSMGLDFEELKASALKNMWDNIRVQSMSDTILEMMAGEAFSDAKKSTEKILKDLENGTMKDMIIVTNMEKMDGAATILCPEFVQSCNQDIVILPSSCHEVIILPHDQGTDLRELQAMVAEINRTSVDPKDFLSDNVYVLDSQTKSISLACDKYGLVPICDDTKLQLSPVKAKAK